MEVLVVSELCSGELTGIIGLFDSEEKAREAVELERKRYPVGSGWGFPIEIWNVR